MSGHDFAGRGKKSFSSGVGALAPTFKDTQNRALAPEEILLFLSRPSMKMAFSQARHQTQESTQTSPLAAQPNRAIFLRALQSSQSPSTPELTPFPVFYLTK
jgi:hypothetical protein